MRAKDRKLAAITTPIGRFVLTRGAYGFKNIATFAQMISNRIMQPLGRAGAFIDDMFIKHQAGATDGELLATAEKFLQRCEKYGMVLNPEKTFLFVPEITFIGYNFNQTGHTPMSKYINKVLKIVRPKTVTEIRAFLGLIQYIARYVHMSKI